MATIVNKFPDRRAELLGGGLGNFIGNVLQAREKKREEEERKKKLAQALELVSQATTGTPTVSPVTESQRQQTALKAGGGPTRRAAGLLETLPRETARVPTGRDVGVSLIDAGFDEEFALTLAQGLDEARLERETEAKQSAALNEFLSVSIEEGAGRKDLIAALSKLPIDPIRKVLLLNNLDELIPLEEDEEKVPFFSRADPGRAPIEIALPKEDALTQESRQAFADKNFPGFTAAPLAPAPDEVSLKAEGIQALFERGVIDEDTRDKLKAGDVLEARGPDQEGRVAIIDKATGDVTFKGGGDLTPSSLRILERRIVAIDDTLTLLSRTDTSQVGITKILAAEIGGVAVQIPIVRSIAWALGFSQSEVARIQADRSEFFTVLGPLIQSFSSGGSRRSLASKQELALAERIANLTRLSSTPGGAELAKAQLRDVLTTIRARLIAQRMSRSIVAPMVIEPEYEMDEDGKIKVILPEGVQ